MPVIRVKPENFRSTEAVGPQTVFHGSEIKSLSHVPTVDLSKYDDTSLLKLFGQGLTESIIQQTTDTPAQMLIMAGHREESLGIFRQPTLDNPLPVEIDRMVFGEDYKFKVAEKIRDFGIALRRKFALDNARSPETFGEQVVQGLGSGIGSMLGMTAFSLAGYALGGGKGSAQAVAMSRAGAFINSYINEKAMMMEELSAAGYSPRYTDLVSSLYALPVASLDTASFTFLSKLLIGPAGRAVRSTIGRRLMQITMAGLEGFVSEGVTEGIQQRIQTETEVYTKLRDRDFQADITNDAVAFVVGGLIGGAAGVSGQLRGRKIMIQRIQDATGLMRNDAAKLVDELSLDLNDVVYDELIERLDLGDDMKWVNKAFAKTEGREELRTGIEDTPDVTPPLYKNMNQLLDAIKRDTEIASVLGFKLDEGAPSVRQIVGQFEKQQNAVKEQITKDYEQQLEGKATEESQARIDQNLKQLMKLEKYADEARRIQDRVEGKVTLSPAQIRQETRRTLNRILTAYKVGKRIGIQDIKNIQRSFLSLLKDSNLSDKPKLRMLRRILSVRTPEQFHNKAGLIISDVNKLIRSEKVNEFQQLGKRILERMIKRDPATPQGKLFAEHLNRLFQERVPPVFDTDPEDIEGMVKQQVEQAVYDLINAEDDAGAAGRALSVLKDYYGNQLRRFREFKERQDITYKRIRGIVRELVLKGKEFDELKAAFDNVRQRDKKSHKPTLGPYDTSFLTILNKLDHASGTHAEEGPLVKEFHPSKPYRAMIVWTHEAKQRIDNRLREIYGDKAEDLWIRHRTNDFLKVLINNKDGTQRMITVPRGVAMSLYLMTKMPGVYNDLIRMGVDENWLNQFQDGNNVEFSQKDYEYMDSVRDTLDWFADHIAPLYENLTGKPFRRIDNYFMTYRYMAQAEDPSGYAESNSVIDAMLKGDFSVADPTNLDRFKSREASTRSFRLPDIFQAVSFYARDMVHFLSYAGYAVKLQRVFGDASIREIMNDRLPAAYSAIIKEHTDNIVKGNISRDADRVAMRMFFKGLGLYARNQVSTPKNFLRQLSGIAAGMDLEGASPKALLEAILDLPRAVKSGELRNLTDTAYMKERLAGMYEMAVLYVQEQAQAGKLKGEVSQRLHQIFTSFVRYGDRFASIPTGWMVYRYQLKKTGDVVQAVNAAIEAIDRTQQSMDGGKVPIVANRPGFVNRLLTIFNRTPMQYLDLYLRSWDNYLNKRITTKEFARTLLTYHVWIPLFETIITAGKFDKWEYGVTALAGPFAYHVILGAALRAFASAVIQRFSGDEMEVPAYMRDPKQGGTLLESILQEAHQGLKAITNLIEYHDFESMWGLWKSLGQVGDITEIPLGWLSRTPEGIYDLLQMDPDSMIRGIKILLGYSEARTKEE